MSKPLAWLFDLLAKLATLYVAVLMVIGVNTWLLIEARQDQIDRAISLIVTVLTVGVFAYHTGIQHMRRQYRRELEWAPIEVQWHHQDGTLHALVTQVSGNVQAIEIPEEAAENAADAYCFVLDILRLQRE